MLRKKHLQPRSQLKEFSGFSDNLHSTFKLPICTYLLTLLTTSSSVVLKENKNKNNGLISLIRASNKLKMVSYI